MRMSNTPSEQIPKCMHDACNYTGCTKKTRSHEYKGDIITNFINYLCVIQVRCRLQIDAQTVLLGLIAARRASVTCEKSTFSLGILALVRLFRLRRRTRYIIRWIIRLVVRPILRMGVAVGPS